MTDSHPTVSELCRRADVSDEEANVAIGLAKSLHAGQVDKGGQPYLDHLSRVATLAERRAYAAIKAGLAVDAGDIVQAAWLHDVVEDTPITLNGLRMLGISFPVLDMVALLTKPAGDGGYLDKLAPLLRSGNLGALLVKLSDNEDNRDPSRKLEGGERLLARYEAARTSLLAAASTLGYHEV